MKFQDSFYTCGTNSVDFYAFNVVDGGLEYNRAKTSRRRLDKAFINIKIFAEAWSLMEKYVGKLQQRYTSRMGLSGALSYGMRKIGLATSISDLSFYWA